MKHNRLLWRRKLANSLSLEACALTSVKTATKDFVATSLCSTGFDRPTVYSKINLAAVVSPDSAWS